MRVITVLATILLLFTPAYVMGSSAEPVAVQHLADAFVQSKRAPGIAIGVLDETGRIRTYCAGTLEVGGGQQVTEDTIFEIGSISKVFTATLAHFLEQQGSLSLSDPVGVHLPDEVDVKVVDGNEIMLWHLATHTSGLPIVPARLKSGESYYPFSLDQLYEFLVNWKPDRAPGEAYLYSNLGYGLLGLVLELNQKASFEALVQRHILRQLNMKSTGCMFEGALADRLATPHRDNQPVSARPWTRPTAGAGGIKSSVKDLMLFARANLANSKSHLHRSLRACQVPRVKAKSRDRVGLAWHVSGESSERIIHHAGATNGFRSFMAFMPDRGRAVVVLANSTQDVGTLGRHILAPDVVGIEKLYWASIDFDDWASIDFDGYVGSYRSASGGRFVIENRNGELFARLDKQNFHAFRPIGEDLFLHDRAKARLRFERDAQERVRTLVLEQNGRKNAYPRVN